MQKGWVRKFNSLQDCTAYLGEEPLLSKLGLIVKERNRRAKKRIILDAKASGVSAVASTVERILLPRILDLVADAIYVADNAAGCPGAGAEF